MAVTVAVVFTDLVGSTALMSRVGESEAEVLRRDHFALLREAAATCGGREVKNLGDGLMIAASSAADAVAIGVEIQRRFERRNRSAAEPLLVRVGVALGDADVDDGDFFGVPVVESARLCAKAGGGEVLVTDVVRILTGSRGGFGFELVGALELKGLDEPVVAHRVVWVPVVVPEERRVPLPARLVLPASPVSQVATVFVGRVAEREVLSRAFKAVGEEGRRVVLLGGEPGIGKTTLSATFARESFDASAVVLYGRCDEDLRIPYQVWTEALGHLVRHAPRAVLDAHLAARGGELARLVPELAAAAPAASTDAESERYLLFGAVVDLLARMSVVAPVVLVLDDLQWADRPTIQLLRHLVSSDVAMRLVVVGTFRDSEITTTHPLAEALAALHREDGVERIALRGLGDDELLSLLESVAGHEMTSDGLQMRDELLAETEGNPFFVHEMLRHLAETGAIFQDVHGRWVATPDLRASGLPVSIREVVERRIAGLGEQTARVLSLASVIGRDFDVEVLRGSTEVDEDVLLDLCDDAVRASVLTDCETPGRYTFAHALIQHTLYDGLSTGRRARTHRLVAEALEEICGDDPGPRIGELAHHWSQATRPADGIRALDYTQRAGDRALAQLAPDEAVRWYRDALELLDRISVDDPRRRIELLIGLGDAQLQTGDPTHRETLLDAARQADTLGETDLLVRAVLAKDAGGASVIGGADTERLEMLTRALDRLGSDDSPARARLVAQLCSELLYDAPFEERAAMAREATAIARRTGDDAALCYTLRMTLDALASPATLHERMAMAAEAVDLATTLGDRRMGWLANLELRAIAIEAADPTAIRVAFDAGRREARRVGQPLPLYLIAHNEATQLTLRGDLGASEPQAEAALKIGLGFDGNNNNNPFVIYSAQLMNIRHMQGRMGELSPLVQKAADENPGLPVYRAVIALSKSFTDDHDDVRLMFDQEVTAGFPMLMDFNWLAAHAIWAEAAVRVQHRGAAEALHARLLPWRAQFATTRVTLLGSVAHHLGTLEHLLERYEEADSSFAEALAVHERMEAPYFIASTECAWAAMLIDRARPGDHARAAELLSTALPAADRGGYGEVERRARSLLSHLSS